MVAIPGAIGHISNGTLIPLAVTSRERVKALPKVPTIAESGVPDYQINAFHGILAPAGTPARGCRAAGERHHRGA